MNGSFLLFGDEQGHQPPYVAKRIPDLVIPEDGREDSINLSGVFADDDTAGLMFSCDDPGPFDVNISALGAVAIVPPPDWHGTRPITLSAEDEFSKAWVVFNLTVTPVDDPPVLEPIDDLHGDQGEPIFIQAVGNDSRDGEDILFYDNTSLFDIDPVSGDATLVPHNHDVGSHPVSVRVVDENGSAAFANFTIEVNNVNDPPEILSLGGTNTSGGGVGPRLHFGPGGPRSR